MSSDISIFEPATPASRTQYSTRSSYVPTHYSFGVVDFWRGLRLYFGPAGVPPLRAAAPYKPFGYLGGDLVKRQCRDQADSRRGV